MNRRHFFNAGIVGGIATAAAVREWPFRVFSFPKALVSPITFAQARQRMRELNVLRNDFDWDGFQNYLNKKYIALMEN